MTRKNRLLEGIPASPGIVMGRAHVLTQEGQIFDPPALQRQGGRRRVEVVQSGGGPDGRGTDPPQEEISEDLKEHAHILELHLLILRDRMLLMETLKLIQEQNLNAERALHQAYLKIKELFQRIGDKHIRGRIRTWRRSTGASGGG